MRFKKTKILLICGLMAISLCACNKEEGGDAPPEDVVAEEPVQQAVNLAGVEAGTVLDTDTLIQYANSLTGLTDIQSIACYTDTESGVTEVTLVEGIHTITIAYNTASGGSGETQLTYEATPATATIEDPVSEETPTTDADGMPIESEDVSEEEVSIPLENRIILSVTDGTASMTNEEFTTDETIEPKFMVNVSDVGATLSMYDPLGNMGSRTVSNMYESTELGVEYLFDDANYIADISYNVYNIDEFIYFSVESESAEEPLYFGFKLSEEALEDDSLLTDESNELFAVIEDYYAYEFTYEPKIIEADSEETSNEESSTTTTTTETTTTETTTTTTTTTETLTTLVGDSYKEKYPQLFIWPESEIKYSRWDWRITDQTSFNSNITLADGTVIPEAQQQNEDGYEYDMSSGTAINRNDADGNVTRAEEIEEEKQEAIVTVGLRKFRINEYPAENITIDYDRASDKSVPLVHNGSVYYVKSVTSDNWLKYADTDYYGENLPNTEIVLAESFEIGTGNLKTSVIARDIHFTDSTGADTTRSYMYGVNCNTEYLIIVGESMPTRGNNVLSKIAQNCIEPIENE